MVLKKQYGANNRRKFSYAFWMVPYAIALLNKML